MNHQQHKPHQDFDAIAGGGGDARIEPGGGA
jgi:hypothetical protein